jgi:hypothetical protein
MEKEINLNVKARFDGKYCGDRAGNRFCLHFGSDEFGNYCYIFEADLELINRRIFRCEKCIEKFGYDENLEKFNRLEKLKDKIVGSSWYKGSLIIQDKCLNPSEYSQSNIFKSEVLIDYRNGKQTFIFEIQEE